LLGGTKWNGAITYSFPDSPSDYLAGYSTSNEPTTGFSPAPTAEQAAINYAVGLIMSYTNASIQFAGTGSANIQIAQSSAANPTAYAYYPSNAATGTGGDVWFGTAYDFSQAKLGNYYFLTGLHELGHAFGLKHSQETGGVANVAVPSAHDDSEFTVMSYRSYVGGPLTGYTNEAYGYPQTYMANDILALQTLYGANFSTQSGNTTYSWNPATGQEFINGVGQPAPGGGAGGSANRVFMTVWDGGGNDTYDLSNYSTAVSINLNPGASSITSTTQLAYLGGGHYAQGNVFNAYLYNNDARSYIDNAIGGAGNDTLVGNPIGNTLSGGAGSDRITGGGGDDFIDGGSGSDVAVFSGNLNSYRISWSSATQAFTVADQRAGAPDGTDTIVGVENFQFADGTFSSSLFTAAINHAPVVTVADVKANQGQVLQVSSLVSATDPDNDALTYYFQDNSTAANSGHFVVNGTAIAAGTSFGVSAAQLAQTVFVAGTGASDDLVVQVSDGQATSNVAGFHVNINHAPVVAVADISASPGQTLQAASLFGATDADNDTLMYYFADLTPDSSFEDYAPDVITGHFVVNGTAIAAGTSFGVSAAQLAQTVFVVGNAGTSDHLAVQVTDGQAVSNMAEFHLNANAVNHAPLLAVPATNISANAGQTLQMSSLFSATDPDSNALTYYFYDSTAAANSGHFVLNGTAIAAGTSFGVNAAQLAQLVFVAGAAGTTDDLGMQVSDGQTVSAMGQFHVTVINHAPLLTVPATNISAAAGQSLQVSTLFSATDADNDALIYYFADNSPAPNSGHFMLNGTAIAGASFGVNATQLAQLVFLAGAAGTSDDLGMQVSDGHSVSGMGQFHIDVPVNHAPVLTVPATNISAAAGQSLQVSSLFSATDADNDALTYYFQDNSPAANSGHFVVNGTVVPAGTSFGVSAAQLAQTVFVAGAAGTSDDVGMQVTDGHAVSAMGQFHLTAFTPVPGNGMFSGEAAAEDPSHDTFPGMASSDIHFDAGGNSGFAFLPTLGAANHGAVDVPVPPVNQNLAAAAVGSSDTAGAAIHLDPFGDAIALHAVHPADTFIV
jgi:serralysin